MVQTNTISGETEITISSVSVPHCWIENQSSSTMYASAESGIVAKADGVLTIPAGAAKLFLGLNSNSIYILGTGDVETQPTYFANANFKKASGGGGETQETIIEKLDYRLYTNIYINDKNTGYADGTSMFPFKTLDDAAQYITGLESPSGITITLAHSDGYYFSNSFIFPDCPIVINGNLSSVINPGTMTITNPNFICRDLYTNAQSGVIFNNFTAGARCVLQGGGIIGNVTINSYVEILNCQLTDGIIGIGSTGQLVCTLCSPTSTFTSAGVLILTRVNINTGRAGEYLITSTAGQLTLSDCIIVNSSTGASGCVSCNNGATTAPNMIANNSIVAAGGNALNLGTAACLYSKNYIVGAVSGGTGLIPVSSDITGAGNIMALGSDATGDMYYRSATGVLTRLGVGTSGQVLKGGTTPSWGDYITLVSDLVSTTKSITLADKTEYRFGELTSLSITWTTADISCLMAFTGGTGITFTITAGTKIVGIDTVSNVFTPIVGKRYNLGFSYDGINRTMYVSGVS